MTTPAPAARPTGPRFAPARGASEQIALEIRRYLEEQRLEPGDRIGTEQELADEFGVSRPTLREALRLLSASHLIRVGRGRGGGIFVARTPSEGMSRNVSESIALMLAAESDLDGRAARRAAVARGPARRPRGGQRRRRRRRARSRRRSPTPSATTPGTEPFNSADTRFHQILAEAAGNDLLRAFTRWILEVLQPSLVAHIAADVDAGAILDQHRAILRAVRRHQRSAAERAMQAHIEYLVGVLQRIDSD